MCQVFLVQVTWHNSIPRYAMLSLSWRFNVNPKKKNADEM